MPNALPMAGRISEARLSDSPMRLIRTNTGMIVVWTGTIMVARNSAKIAPRPGKRTMANAYPLSVQVTICAPTIRPVTITLFRKNRPSDTSPNTAA